MTVRKMHFIGLLRNVDSSILNVKLENNFKFNSISDYEGGQLFSVLEHLPSEYITRRLFMEYRCLNPKLKKYFFVENSFDVTLQEGGFPKELIELQDLVNHYLVPKIRLMRLFKEGDISMPLKYYFFENPFSPYIRMWMPAHLPYEPMYTLNEDEIPKLQDFLKNAKMPFRDYIQLAFDNFESSYEIHVRNVAFLSLMNGLEALFNPGRGEIRYRISRNCAVLLGKDKQEATEIYRNVKELYGLRSSIVHSFKKISVEEEKLIELRGYLRESIKRLLRVNKPKEEVLDILNESGFGEQI